MTPDERAGLRQAIANDPGTMSWPSKTVSELLDDLDAAEAELDEVTNLDRSALKTQELRDERHRAVAMWHEQKKRAGQAEAERDQARAQVADYENRICWDTTCGQCATVLDRAIADYERAEAAGVERDRARETNRRLNLRTQELESRIAIFVRAVNKWTLTADATYVPLGTLAEIAKAAGRQVDEERFELHGQRLKSVEQERDRLRQEIVDARGEATAEAIRADVAEAHLAALHEEWAFQYVSYGVTETSLVCESREEAEREAGRHRRGDRIVHRLCGDWEAVEGVSQ